MCRVSRPAFNALPRTEIPMNHILTILLLVVLIPMAGCGKTVESRPAPPPPPTYSGPEFLRTTIGSQVTIAGYQPVLVSGFGLVVNLKGTGSPDCPPQLRQWMINELSRGGFGQESLGYGHLPPEQVLNSNNTAVVIVEGVIPPGATAQTRFDVMVKALPGTQTTSLEGGVLYTAPLSIYGALTNRPSSRTLAQARGPVFSNPFARLKDDEQRTDDRRIGRLPAGAVLLEDMPLLLRLNQPSYAVRRITDRINARFPAAVADKEPLATAKNPQTIRLKVLKRFRANPKRMLEQILHLYLNPTEAFARQMAEQLAQMITEPGNAEHTHRVALAWIGMGRLILPQLQQWYAHENVNVRMAALEAGATLGDLRAAEPLYEAAVHAQPGQREKAAGWLGQLMQFHPRNMRMIRNARALLDHKDALVAMEACLALTDISDGSVNVRQFPDKLELLIVRCERPMVYVTREGAPRIILFNQMQGFQKPLFFSCWDGRLMIKNTEDQQTLGVYHRPANGRGQSHRIAPALANLIYLMAHRPTDEQPGPGLDLSYSQIVEVLARLDQSRVITAPLVLQSTDLDRVIDSARKDQDAQQRPESQENGAEGVENRDEISHNQVQ